MPPPRKTQLPPSAFDNAAQFARITSSRWPTIRFVGVWDTVASVIVPRADRFYWPSLEELAFTLQNPSVQTFRQAISIDERRCMFRLKKWYDPQTFKHNRFNDAHAEPQDILQVWFAGVHADIGGGYPEKESGLSKYPLLWMIDEAIKCGLKVNQRQHQPARLGHSAQEQPVLLCRARRARRSAHFAVGRVVAPRISAEEREVQGMAGAERCISAITSRTPSRGSFRKARSFTQSAIERMNAMPGYRPVNMPASTRRFRCRCRRGMASAERRRMREASEACRPSSAKSEGGKRSVPTVTNANRSVVIAPRRRRSIRSPRG